jgi:hypothetical protein
MPLRASASIGFLLTKLTKCVREKSERTFFSRSSSLFPSSAAFAVRLQPEHQKRFERSPIEQGA